MIVALDIDGTIDESVELFHILSTVLRSGGHRLIILTYRDPARVSQTQEQLRDWGISYDEIVFAESLDDKGRICRELNVDVFFEDQDECIVPVDERTLVCKLRNGGNFDFEERVWLSTDRLTRLL